MLSDLEPDKCANSSVLDLARSKSFGNEASRGPWSLYQLKGNSATLSNYLFGIRKNPWKLKSDSNAICTFHFLFDLGQRELGSLLCHPTHDLLQWRPAALAHLKIDFFQFGIFFVGHSLGFSASQWVFHNQKQILSVLLVKPVGVSAFFPTAKTSWTQEISSGSARIQGFFRCHFCPPKASLADVVESESSSLHSGRMSFWGT